MRNVKAGSYPYGAAILRDNRTGLVANQATGSVSVIDLRTPTKVKDIQVGPKALPPRGDRARPARRPRLRRRDELRPGRGARHAAAEVERTLSVGRPEGLGVAPVDLAVSPDGRSLLVAEAGADELAVFRLPRRAGPALTGERARAVLSAEVRRAVSGRGLSAGEPEEAAGEGAVGGARPAASAFQLVGRIPVASYPVDVEVTAKASGRPSRLLWTSGKGLGVGPNPRGPDPTRINDDNANGYRYLPAIVTGRAGIAAMPGEQAI